MFERRTRDPFPARNIIILLAIVAAFLWWIFNHFKK